MQWEIDLAILNENLAYWAVALKRIDRDLIQDQIGLDLTTEKDSVHLWYHLCKLHKSMDKHCERSVFCIILSAIQVSFESTHNLSLLFLQQNGKFSYGIRSISRFILPTLVRPSGDPVSSIDVKLMILSIFLRMKMKSYLLILFY